MTPFTFIVTCNCRINGEARTPLKLGPEHFGLDFALVETSEKLATNVNGKEVGHVCRIKTLRGLVVVQCV